MAEPGSSNKLSKRKLDKYLKHPDFKKLYDHGLRIAQSIGHAASGETFNPVIVDFYRTVGYLPQRWSTTCCCWAGRWTTRPSSSRGRR